MKKMKKNGLSIIELLIAVTIVGLMTLLAIWAFHLQIAKGRDAKRKADLAKLQKVLEDYFNDDGCYPESLTCNQDFLPYLSAVPCDPVNDGRNHIYLYSVSSEGTCKRWYKIFTTLENSKDPIIKKIGCTFTTCGNFNYVVASANAEILVQQPGEVSPPGGGASPTSTPTSPPATPTQGGPTSTPTPTPTQGPTPTPTSAPTPCLAGWYTCVNQGGKCNITYEGAPGAVCSSTCNFCTAQDCSLFPICLF
jgi:prepilin-type N-terminal cleavage/methylation domain-containing protein